MNKLKTTNIKGKEYVEVNQRLKYFREHFADHALTTTIEHMDDNTVLFKAVVENADGRTVATGFAYEDKRNGMINKTSHIENGETSAWGRALANFGIGIDGSVASADEVDCAIKQQESMNKLKEVKPKSLGDVLQGLDMDAKEIKAFYAHAKINNATQAEAIMKDEKLLNNLLSEWAEQNKKAS